jgi:hypothetical protein
MDALEAARGIASIYLVKYSDQLDAAFGNLIVAPVPEGDLKQRQMKVALDAVSRRMKVFFDAKEGIVQALLALGRQYLRCHGV